MMYASAGGLWAHVVPKRAMRIMPLASSSPPRSPTPASGGWLPVWMHLLLSILCSLAGAAAGFVGAVVVDHGFALPGQSLYGFAILAALTFSGFLLPAFVFHKLIPARCRKCGGRCWARVTPSSDRPRIRMYDTLKYYCERCGWVVDTRFGAGQGG